MCVFVCECVCVYVHIFQPLALMPQAVHRGFVQLCAVQAAFDLLQFPDQKQ